MTKAIVGSNGRVTIPTRVRAALRIYPGDRIEFVEIERGTFAIVPINKSVKELNGLFRGRVSKPISIEEMNAVIAQRR